ncbi:hypothetical protein HELRODRAFT_167119 [Helobdella robusta]|uniref:WSC domain-containing protein n=1 Tax=Helobdella robusta TaxID=6412 RepID=T1EZ17_HELRO|nr:hypothetical protein HELRODRAFT_167119 [Helobdella robusta]ESO10613.1 hypothetical protein HELRODRAFT_167119 [Helobdella robusta]
MVNCIIGPVNVSVVGIPYSVLCQKKQYFRYVLLQQARGNEMLGPLTITEIEIFGKDQTPRYKDHATSPTHHTEFDDLHLYYVGCFIFFASMTYAKVTKLQECKALCTSIAAIFMAVKRGFQCHCGSNLDHKVDSLYCSIRCSDSEDFCGGPDHFSVYSDPIYATALLSCFEEDPNSTLTGKNSGIFFKTNKKFVFLLNTCYSKCREYNFSFAAVKNTRYCSCGNSLEGYTVASNQRKCDKSCVDSHNLKCGGVNASSIYAIDLPQRYEFGEGYTYLMNCLESQSFGTNFECKNRKCVEGWKGVACQERTPSSSSSLLSATACDKGDGNCKSPLLTCASAMLGTRNVSECICRDNKGMQADRKCKATEDIYLLVDTTNILKSTLFYIILISSLPPCLLLIYVARWRMNVWKQRREERRVQMEEFRRLMINRISSMRTRRSSNGSSSYNGTRDSSND